jgi:hypothetical protein
MEPLQFLKMLEPFIPDLLKKVGGDAYSLDLLQQAQELLSNPTQEGAEEAIKTIAKELTPYLSKFLPPPFSAGVAVAAELFPHIIQHFTEKGVTVVYETSDLDHPPEVI